MKVNFYDTVNDERLMFAVIVSKHNGKWVFCRHRERSTYECPGGHREKNESIYETAKRELWEETGAISYHLQPICVYSVEEDGKERFGMLYFADIFEFSELPPLEIADIYICNELPNNWTYPLIQPLLLEKVGKHRSEIGMKLLK